jgi:hypothetical protein
MATSDYENVDDRDDLDDGELRQLVRDHLAEHRGLDIDDLTVSVRDGVVHLGGRVGTEGELRIAEHVVTDVVGLRQVVNDILVDPIRRADSPEAIDDHLVDEDEHEGLMLGDRSVPIAPAVDWVEEDLDALLGGTHDLQGAIENAESWIPPERPTQEGISGDDAGPNEMNDRH